MRYQTDDASSFFEASIVLGKNKKLAEFRLESIDECTRTLQAFVPVQDGQRLKILCKANELMKGSMIDVVIDGILRDTYLHQKKQDGDVTINFDSGIYKSGKSLRRGKFTVHACPLPAESFSEIGNAKVGTIELRLHRAHTSEATAEKDIPDPEQTNTYHSLSMPWNPLGVVPDCDITLDGEEILNQSKRISYRRAFSHERPGHTAWSTLRFVYRTSERLVNEAIMEERGTEYTYIRTATENDFADSDGEDEMLHTGNASRAGSVPEDLKELKEEALSPSAGQKRKRDERDDRDDVNRIVDQITFGHGYGPSASFAPPSKRSKEDLDSLEKEVRELTAVATQNKRRAETARTKLVEKVRKRTEADRKYEMLMAKKAKAQKEIAKANQEEELYTRQLNNEESD